MNVRGAIRSSPSGPARSSMRLAARSLRRAFSLAEVLLAIMILAIGLIAVGSLFPAAIFQQRLSTDETVGPLVAESALNTLRNKLRPEMFGTMEDMYAFFGAQNLPVGLEPSGGFPARFAVDYFQQGNLAVGDWVIQPGDWEWRRPAFFLNDPESIIPVGSNVTSAIPRGSIAIFRNSNVSWGPNVTASEVPWNVNAVGVNPGGDPFLPFANPPILASWGNQPQPVIFRPEERAFPPSAAGDRPLYRWEVMFRRYQGRILAAIFVFRVGQGGGEVGRYIPPTNTAPLDPARPPIPARVQAPVPMSLVPSSFELAAFAPWLPGGPDSNPSTLADNNRVPGTQSGSPFDAADPRYGWQATGQWLLDQNNVIHRVQRGRRLGTDDWVTLTRPVPLLADVVSNIRRINTPLEGPSVLGVWFLPPVDGAGNNITPIYVTVKELF